MNNIDDFYELYPPLKGRKPTDKQILYARALREQFAFRIPDYILFEYSFLKSFLDNFGGHQRLATRLMQHLEYSDDMEAFVTKHCFRIEISKDSELFTAKEAANLSFMKMVILNYHVPSLN